MNRSGKVNLVAEASWEEVDPLSPGAVTCRIVFFPNRVE